MSTLVLRTVQSIAEMDRLSIVWVSKRRSPAIDRLMKALTRAGDWQSWTLALITASLAGETGRKLALAITPPLLLTLATCYIIKFLSRRPRPSKSLGGFSALLHNPDPYSFPSSHTACAFAVCVATVNFLGPAWFPLIAYAALIGYSRIHVGAHYPLDVLIGAAIGTVIALIV